MRDFLKYTAATVLGLLIFLGAGIGGLIWLIVSLSVQEPGSRVANQSVLTLDMSLDITDAPASPMVSQALSQVPATVTMRSLLDAIDQAAQDSRIVGLYLHGSIGRGQGAGFATLREVREALQRFRAAGKPIIAYDVNWQEREYYLGSVANTVVLHPYGDLELNGLSSEPMFYAGALEKLGVGMQVTRVGKYKSAVEPFLLKELSPASREQTEVLLTDLWQEILNATGQARKLPPAQLQTIANQHGELMPEMALQKKLVDKLAYQDEVLAELRKMTGEGEDQVSFRQVSLKTYATEAEKKSRLSRSSGNQVAVVYAEGEIVNGRGDLDEVGGDRFAKQLRELRSDDSVKAVVLRINSPGGSVVASEVIQREVVLLRQKKPVVVSMGSVAASGGYWIATYADRIFAEPTTITGSIGVFGLLPNVQKLANNLGVTWDVVKTGQYADIQTLSRPKTPQELAQIQKSVDRIYDQFISKVAESRKLPKQKVVEIAQGRVWSGTRAKSLGLVDELGGLNQALQEAAKRAKLGDDWQLVEYPQPTTLAEQLLGNPGHDLSAQSFSGADGFERELRKFQADLKMLRAMNDPRNAYVRLPINFNID